MSNYDQSLNTQHIAANLSKYEAGRTGFFTLIVDDLTNLLNVNYKGEIGAATDSDKIKNAQEILKLNVTKCDVPYFKVGTLEYKRGNDVVRFAGMPEFQGGTITVDDVVGLDTKSLLYSWLSLAYNPHTRKTGLMKDYKKTATLCEYSADYKLIRSWTLEGVFVTGISDGGFDRTSDAKNEISVDFSYDRATMELPEEQSI